nr:BFH_HP1_G0048500.mRNA.1.CDS.1 [Saccharomyces cerevisiae]
MANDILFPAVQVNAVYEDVYLLGTSWQDLLLPKPQLTSLKQEGCFAVSQGCTGKGNDQMRFELSFYALKPDVKCITPWRMPEFSERFAGRKDLLDYAAQKGIPVAQTKAKPWSTDEKPSPHFYEAGILEDPDTNPTKGHVETDRRSNGCSDQPQDLTIDFERGLPAS